MAITRSRRDSRMFGLCGGLAEQIGISATPLRVVLAVGTVMTGGVLGFGYIIASMVVPKESWEEANWKMAIARGHGYRHNAAWGGAEPASPWGAHAGGADRRANIPVTPSLLDAVVSDLEEQSLLREVEALRERLHKLEHHREQAASGSDRTIVTVH